MSHFTLGKGKPIVFKKGLGTREILVTMEGKFQTKSLGRASPSERFFDANSNDFGASTCSLKKLSAHHLWQSHWRLQVVIQERSNPHNLFDK